MASKRKQPKGAGRGSKDPFAPPAQFLAPANNRELLDRAAAIAKKTVNARQTIAKAARREPLPIRSRAAEWSETAYVLRDSSDSSDSYSNSSDDEYSGAPARPTFPADQAIIDLDYIAKKRPPPHIIRNFLRAQATSINSARSEDEFA